MDIPINMKGGQAQNEWLISMNLHEIYEQKFYPTIPPATLSSFLDAKPLSWEYKKPDVNHVP